MVLVLLVLAALLAWPVLTLLGAWWMLDAAGWAQWQHLAQTVLPGYVAQTAWLVLGVGLGTLLVGGGAATLVSLFEFRGRRWLDALLLLPMAMPAYVAAYAYTDALQFAGPLQSGLRQWFGWQGALWGDVRSLPGAVLLFTLCLYPYVYLLVRTALAERAAAMLEAAQMLGAPLHRRVLQVALPMARPALAAGLMLVLMETLADYGVGSYFGLNTLSTGVYKAWLVHDDRWAAAQIASLLLGIALTCLWLERRAQARMRFASGRGGGEGLRQPLNGAAALAAQAACLLPLLAGFVLPVLILARLVWREARYGEFGLPWERFGGWALSSLKLALAAATLAVALALLITALQRLKRQPAWRNAALRGIGTLVAMGYAMPGAAIAVALLLPLQPLQQRWPVLAPLFTGTVLALMLAYCVRFTGVALQSVGAGYARLPGSLDESARLLGRSDWGLWWSVHRPLLTRSAWAAALLVFVDVMKELPATLLLRPFDSDTLAVVAYQLARDERLAEAALPALAIVAVGLLPLALLWRAMRLR
nr:iron ABC transporter permease [Pseudorhodoferax sp.]